MFERVRTATTDPGVALADSRPRLGRRLSLVFVLGLVTVAGLLLPALVRARSHPEFPTTGTVSLVTGGGTVQASTLSLGLIALGLLAPFLTWAILALALHAAVGLVALITDGNWRESLAAVRSAPREAVRGTADALYRTAAAVGWGYWPQLVATLLTLAGFLIYLVVGPAEPVGVNLTIAGHTTVYARSAAALTVWSHGVGALCTLWTGYVWVGALEAYRGLTRRRALAAVAPVLLLVVAASDLDAFLLLLR